MLSSFLLILYLGLAQQMLCEPIVVYKMTNMECTTTPKYTTNVSCRVKAINWNKGAADMDVDLVKPLKNITVHFQIFQKDYSNHYQPFLVNVYINMCSILSRQNFLPYGVIITKVTKRFSNFNHTCPYEGHIFARGVYLDDEFLPNSIPLGFYKMSMTVYETSSTNMDYAGAVILYMQAMEQIKSKKQKT